MGIHPPTPKDGVRVPGWVVLATCGIGAKNKTASPLSSSTTPVIRKMNRKALLGGAISRAESFKVYFTRPRSVARF